MRVVNVAYGEFYMLGAVIAWWVTSVVGGGAQVAFVTEALDHIANSEVNPTLGARSVGMLGIHLSDLAPSPLTTYTVASDDFQGIVDIVNDLIFCNNFE